jgi:hypothetical protein
LYVYKNCVPRDVLRLVGITLAALFTALVLYPFLHESGHALAALLTGADCRAFRLFPTPYVEVSAAQISRAALAAVGLSGPLLPCAAALICPSKPFPVWCIRLTARGICVLSMLISATAILLRRGGAIMENEDVIQVLAFWPDGELWILSGAVLLSGVLIAVIIKEKPLRKMIEAFP